MKVPADSSDVRSLRRNKELELMRKFNLKEKAVERMKNPDIPQKPAEQEELRTENRCPVLPLSAGQMWAACVKATRMR